MAKRFTPLSPFSAILALLMLVFASGAAQAQAITVNSIDPTSVDMGKIVPGTGSTTFKIGTGTVTKTGTAVWTSKTVNYLVTVGCTGGGSSACTGTSATVTLAVAGSPAGRATITNFTAAAGPNPPTMTARVGTSTVTFNISGIVRNTTRNFYVGFDYVVPDTGVTGLASADFSVSVPGSSQTATIQSTILRAIGLTWKSDLAFGAIMKPTNGLSNTVTINETTGAPSISGTGNGALLSSTRSRATFEVSGEGAQTFTITAPSSVTLNRSGGGSISASLVRSSATGTLGGTIGSAGTVTIGVGGSIPVSGSTTAGTYSGTFQVTVQYN